MENTTFNSQNSDAGLFGDERPNESHDENLGYTPDAGIQIQTPPATFRDVEHEDVKVTLEGLPDVVTNMISENSEKFAVPLEFSIAGAIMAISGAAGNKATLQTPGFDNAPNIFVGNIAPSGSGKTHSTRRMLAPLIAIDAEMQRNSMRELDAARREQQANKTVNVTLPTYRQIFVEDFTPESLFNVINQNPAGVIIHDEELVNKFNDWDKYKRGAGGAKDMLKLFDRTAKTVSRKGSDPIFIEKPFVSIFGGMQPAILKNHFSKGDLMADGTMARFLLFFRPDVKDEGMKGEDISEYVSRKWSELINTIHRAAPAGIFHLSPDAELLYRNYTEYTRTKKNEKDPFNERDSYLQSVYAKLNINVLRLALIASIMSDPHFDRKEVTGAQMKWAINMCYYFEKTQMLFYDAVFPDDEAGEGKISKAAKVIAKIMQKNPELYRGNPCRKELEVEFGVSHQIIAQAKRIAGIK